MFTAKLLKKAYGYDSSGEVYETPNNLRDTTEPQEGHRTPNNPANSTVDGEALREFPELLENREPNLFPVRTR